MMFLIHPAPAIAAIAEAVAKPGVDHRPRFLAVDSSDNEIMHSHVAKLYAFLLMCAWNMNAIALIRDSMRPPWSAHGIHWVWTASILLIPSA